MKIVIYLFSFLIVGCVATHDQIIRDPIFEENYLIYRSDNKQEYLINDPLFDEKANYLLQE